MEVYVKNFFDFHNCFFLVFSHDFVTCIDFTRSSGSNTAMMTSQIMSHVKYLADA